MDHCCSTRTYVNIKLSLDFFFWFKCKCALNLWYCLCFSFSSTFFIYSLFVSFFSVHAFSFYWPSETMWKFGHNKTIKTFLFEWEIYRSRMFGFFRGNWMKEERARFNMRFGRIDTNRITIALTFSITFTMLSLPCVIINVGWWKIANVCLHSVTCFFSASFQSEAAPLTQMYSRENVNSPHVFAAITFEECLCDLPNTEDGENAMANSDGCNHSMNEWRRTHP